MRETPAARSPAAGAEGEGLLAASAIGKVPPWHRGDVTPPLPGEYPPANTVESIGAGSGESICLSLAMGNIQPFVSLDEVRYSAACHENTGAKWLPRPPPSSLWGRSGRPGTLPCPGEGWGRPASERGRDPAAGRTGRGNRGAPQPLGRMPKSHVPVPPSRHAHPQIPGLAGAP